MNKDITFCFDGPVINKCNTCRRNIKKHPEFKNEIVSMAKLSKITICINDNGEQDIHCQNYYSE